MAENSLHINIDAVLRSRLPRHYRFIPRWAVRWLERTICQRQLNEILDAAANKQNVEFATAVLNHLGVKLTIKGIENLPCADSPHIFVCNHPLGALDGIALISLLGKHYTGNIRFLVNDLLMAVTPLKDIFLPVNKYGKLSRCAAVAIDSAYANPHMQIITFPAGLCSRLANDGSISDLSWHKSFVMKAIETHRNVVPMHFEGQNSNFFYRLARLRKRLGLKFNIETLYLPSEIFKCEQKEFIIHIGKPIDYRTLSASSPQTAANEIKKMCYALSHNNTCKRT